MLCTVWHTENGGDSPRIPYKVQAKKPVEIWIGTWPIEPGQSVWIEYKVNGGSWKKIQCNWQYNSNVNSYWRGVIPGLSLQADATVIYRINAKQGNFKIPDREGERPCPCPCLCGPWSFHVYCLRGDPTCSGLTRQRPIMDHRGKERYWDFLFRPVKSVVHTLKRACE